MRPEVGEVLGSLANTLTEHVAPALEGHYAGGHAGMIGLMSVMAASSWDNAVDIRMRELKTLRNILRNAIIILEPGELRSRIESAMLYDEPADYRISTLNGSLDDLTRVLIDLQSHAEISDTAEMKDLNKSIWDYLVTSATERMPALPEFGEPE